MTILKYDKVQCAQLKRYVRKPTTSRLSLITCRAH